MGATRGGRGDANKGMPRQLPDLFADAPARLELQTRASKPRLFACERPVAAFDPRRLSTTARAVLARIRRG
jgi:hypothetical protein